MKLQFSTKSLLLATTIVAITCSGMIGYNWALYNDPSQLLSSAFSFYCLAGPLWLPLVFAAFALGRKSISVWLVVALAISVAAAVALDYAILAWIWK